MDKILNIIPCCKKEELNNIQSKYEINVPQEKNENNDLNSKNISFSPEKTEFKHLDSSNLKSSEINNNTTLNENHNTTNNNTIEENSNINSFINNLNENINNTNIITENKNFNSSQTQININKVDTFAIPNKEESTPSKNNNISNSNLIPSPIKNYYKTYNNSESQKNFPQNNFFKMSSSKNCKESNSNKETILTLNDLVLIQNHEEKYSEIGSKLLLSGELFFWKEIILQTNGIKNSLRKEKDEHVFFGLKNKPNFAGALYNDLIINFFWHQDDVDMIEKNTGRVFEIYYNKKTKDYTLKFLHPNLILYYKINNFVYFNTGKEYYLLLGSVFITINVKKTSPIEKTIIIQVEIENNKPIKYSFNQNQAPIKIGRINNSEIPIFNSTISKRHGIIEYSKNIQCFYYKDMGSTNSSTLLVKEGDNLKIKGEMNFKLEDVPFKIQEIP